MSRPIRIAPHLSAEALDAHYENAVGVLQSHLLVIRLARMGRHSAEICEISGFCRDWVFEIVRRYNAQGLAGLEDPRKHNKGRPRRMSEALDQELRVALEGPAPDGGPWSSRKVAAWLQPDFEASPPFWAHSEHQNIDGVDIDLNFEGRKT